MGASTVPGGSIAPLNDAERQTARNLLAKLRLPGSGVGSHLGSQLENATVSSGSSLSLRQSTVGLGASTLLSARGSDTFMGGVRSAPHKPALSVGNDTVVGGSTTGLLGHTSEAAHGGQHFALSTDTINVAGATAAGLQTGHPHTGTGTHTITLADKTTIKIAGLSAHDVSKLHH